MQSNTFIRYRNIIVLLVLLYSLMAAMVFAAPSEKATLQKLLTFLNQLERKHPQFKISQAKIQAAKARTQAASQPLYNPEVELNSERVDFNRQQVDTLTIGLQQTIDWHDKHSAKRNISIVEEQMTQLEQQQTHQQLITHLFSALVDYQLQR